MGKESKRGGKGNRQRKALRGAGTESEAALKETAAGASAAASDASTTPAVPLKNGFDPATKTATNVAPTAKSAEPRADSAAPRMNPASTQPAPSVNGATAPGTPPTKWVGPAGGRNPSSVETSTSREEPPAEQAARAQESEPTPASAAARRPYREAPDAASPASAAETIRNKQPDAVALPPPPAEAAEPTPAKPVEQPLAKTEETTPAPAETEVRPQADIRPTPEPSSAERNDADAKLEPPAPLEVLAPEPAPTPPAEQPPEVHRRPSLFVVHITPELAPVAKVGGLGDVVFGLAREMEIRGNHLEIVLPKYDSMRYDHIWDLQPCYGDLWVPWYGGAIHCTVYFGMVHGRKCFFIEPHSRDNFFNRGSIYGFQDDLFRFAFFSRAAIEFLWKSGKHPDIIHCHDWQTALVPVLLYEIYQQLGMTHPRVCFTIHNFMHQGLNGMELLRATGLHRPEYFFHYDRLRDNNNPYAINLTKGGIVYSNFVTTVSPRHAGEAKDFGQGFGLDPTLKTHAVKYGGVVNGIDYDVWNPGADPHIPVHYDVENLDRKYDNKRALRHRLLMADNEKPLVAFVGRLDPQKGLELVRHAIFYTLGRGGQFALLGSSPDSRINNDFWGLKRQLNEDPNSHLEIGYNEELAHLIYAGADMVIVPSRFEPCGLTQLIAMRYGTIPIVREIGGLVDTVFDKDTSHLALHERNGYVFRDYDNRGLESALGRAISCYYNHYPDFRELMKNAMRYDYSWNHPGRDYLNIYDFIRAR